MQEEKRLHEDMFGAPKPVSAEEYSQIYQLTGIDIDGRRDLVEHMIPRLENNMRQWIAFVKAVPGFQCLPLEDQIALIKSKVVLKYPSVHLKIGGSGRGRVVRVLDSGL